MSSGLMDTEAGGEQTQYEGAATENQPAKKSAGQLGSSMEHTTTDPSQTQEKHDEDKATGERKAENMRYGQAISEEGVGGMTNVATGEAKQEGHGR